MSIALESTAVGFLFAALLCVSALFRRGERWRAAGLLGVCVAIGIALLVRGRPRRPRAAAPAAESPEYCYAPASWQSTRSAN